MNLYSYNPDMYTSFLGDQQQNNTDPFTFCNQFADFSGLHQIVPYQLRNPNADNHAVDLTEVPEIPDTCFNYITNLLRENNSEDRPGVTLHDYMAAQVSYNKSLDAALLGEPPSLSSDHHFPVPVSQSPRHCLDDYVNMFASNSNNSSDSNVACANVANVGNIDSVVYQNNMVGNDGISTSRNASSNVGCKLLNGGHISGLVEPQGACVISGSVINGGDNNLHHYDESGFGFFGNESWNLEQNRQIQNLPDVIQGNLNMYCNTNTLLQNPIPQIGLLESQCPNFGGHNEIGQEEVVCNDTSDKTRGRKRNEGDKGGDNGGDNDGDNQVESLGDGEVRTNKQSHVALSDDWCDQMEKYGEVLLCPEGRSKPGALCGKSKSQTSDGQKEQKVSRKRGTKGQVVDLRALLTRCAHCVARVDLIGAYDMLKQIRQHSSPYGDFLQRVAHYLANGLEARLEGKGSELTRANEHISPCEVLKANRVFVGSVPFKIMSYYTTNKTIASLAMNSSSIHIIDFGIYYGLQWPCIIQNLSKRPNGPPKIRITGIDFPQRGFRPAERVEETGKCLAKYCEKYNVPFEYNGIAQHWETIKLEDLKIEPNEPLVVNCLYRSHNLFDESVDDSSPRDAFLALVGKINPDIFMHGVVNSTSSVPFFLNRFKEVMFHYSALFDVFESTMSREDDERMLLESKMYGNQALNVIACEGPERIERPETYKQWQVRTQRAGFDQVPLDRDLVRRARAMVKRSFRDEFSYDEDGHWVVQGWKGRILYAISCWKPA